MTICVIAPTLRISKCPFSNPPSSVQCSGHNDCPLSMIHRIALFESTPMLSLGRLAIFFMLVNTGLGLLTRSFDRRSFWSRRLPTKLLTSSTRALCVKTAATGDKFESPIPLPSSCKLVFDLQLPEGRCLGFSVKDLSASHPDSLAWEQISGNEDHWIRSWLHPDEVSYGLNEVVSTSSLSPTSSFWVGRLAMRAALGFPDYPVVRDTFGRPSLPRSIRGSISHKQGVGVALVQDVAPCSDKTTSGIGVDLEFTSRPRKRSIAKRVLTKQELGELGRLPDVSLDEETLLRFRYVRIECAACVCIQRSLTCGY